MTRMWIVKDAQDFYYPNIAGYDKNKVIKSFVSQNWPDLTWKKLYRVGYRCVEVYLEEA